MSPMTPPPKSDEEGVAVGAVLGKFARRETRRRRGVLCFFAGREEEDGGMFCFREGGSNLFAPRAPDIGGGDEEGAVGVFLTPILGGGGGAWRGGTLADGDVVGGGTGWRDG